MHPLARGLLSSWEWRPEVIFVLLAMGTLYTLGWLRLRQQSRRQKVVTHWRLAAYYGGLAALAVAILSPIDVLGGQLLLMHMVQHKLLVMLAAPLLWLGNPFPVVMWALPRPARHGFSTLLGRDSRFRRGLVLVTTPALCWFSFIFVYLVWHDPGMYNLALRKDWVHDLEHITFFAAAMLFWWPVVGAAPHLHKKLPHWVRIIYVLAFVPPNAIAGFVIANSPTVIYTYYESVPHVLGLTALQDQAIGGAIMWVAASQMMIMTAVIMLGVMMKDERRSPGDAEPMDRQASNLATTGLKTAGS